MKDLNASLEVWSGLFGLQVKERRKVDSEGIEVAFIALGDVDIELMEPYSDDCAVAKFLKRHGEGIQHIAVSVSDTERAADTLENNDLWIEKIKTDLGVLPFIHPISCNGVAIELIPGDTVE